jgi:hypothetical protein
MYRPRFQPLVLLGILATFAAIYGVWWYAKLRIFKTEIAALSRADAGIRVTAKSMDFSGFPYRLQVIARDAVIERKRADYAVRITTPELTLIQQPWSRGFILGALVQPRIIVSANIQPDFAPLTAKADGAQVSLRLSAKGVRRLSMTLENFTSTLPWTQKPLTATHMEFHGREFVAHDPLPVWKPENPTPPPIFEVYLSGTGLQLDRGPLQLNARAEITGDPEFPHGPLRLADWQASGGTVEIRGANLDKGTLSDSFLRGSFALDKNMRVIGGATIDTACPTWLFQLLEQPVPTDVLKCGSILRHHTLQVRKEGLTLKGDSR